MNFEEFKNNVERWATERGIYEHSTPEAQLLKALSELGELADAIIKNDRKALVDSIGDVAVCLVNYAKMNYLEDISLEPTKSLYDHSAANLVGFISSYIGAALRLGNLANKQDAAWVFRDSINKLILVSEKLNLDFLDCCNAAWHEIKDRKGCMVEGGAFVKEEDLV